MMISDWMFGNNGDQWLIVSNNIEQLLIVQNDGDQ